MSHEPVFALVVDRQIQLFPVTYAIMNERNNPDEDYFYCYDEPKPPITNSTIEYYEAIPKLVGMYVQVEYRVKKKTLEEIFAIIGLQPGHTVTISQVTPELLNAVIILTKERAQELLDEFAKTRGYDDIRSVCTYVNSQIPQYQQEANRAIYLRDLTWSNLYTYLNGITSGSNPLPASWAEIAAVMPELTWT